MARRILQCWFQPIPSNTHRPLSFIGVLLLFGLIEVGPAYSPSPPLPSEKPNFDSAVSEYLGSDACAPCHREIYSSYARTAMGHSMSVVTPDWLRSHQISGSVEDPNNQVTFEVHAVDGKLFQSEYQVGPDGRESFRDTREIEWIIGAGENGFGGLVRNGDHIFQAPLSFYSKARRWELSPGYELGNAGFNRPILPGCISCHSGRPNTAPEGNGHFATPAFSELAIGCENCHGPGLAHVLAAQMSPGSYEGHDGSIINPGSLTPALANDICMSCHQTGDVRVLQPSKDYRGFRPGTPLDETMAILLVPPKRKSPPQQDLLEHYYSMTLSKCYRASGERLTCTSCHDPHFEPSSQGAAAYFRKKCLACHSEQSCTLPLQIREHQQPADDCAGCHMKKRDVQEISHSSITNHRILARPDEPFSDAAFQQTTPALPDLIHLDAIPGKRDVPLPALTLLQAYGELTEKHPEYLSRYYSVLNQLERTDAGNPLVQAALGSREVHAGQYSEAVTHLRKALDGGVNKTVVYTDLAQALQKLNHSREAVAVLEKAADVDPFNASLRKQVIVGLIQVKDYAKAQREMADYVQRFPADLFMRELLRRAQAIGEPK